MSKPLLDFESKMFHFDRAMVIFAHVVSVADFWHNGRTE